MSRLCGLVCYQQARRPLLVVFFLLLTFSEALAQDSTKTLQAPDALSMEKKEAVCVSELQKNVSRVDESTLRELGSLYVLQGKLKQAENLYRQYLRVTEFNGQEYERTAISKCLVELLVMQNRLPEAEAVSKKLMDTNGTDTSVCEDMGLFYLRLGKFEQAAAAFKKARDIANPQNSSKYQAAYVTCLNQGGRPVESAIAQLDLVTRALVNYLTLLPKESVESLVPIAILWLSKSYLGYPIIRRTYEQKSSVWCALAALTFFAVSVLCVMAWKPNLVEQSQTICLLLGYVAPPVVELLYLSYRARVRPNIKLFAWLFLVNALGMITVLGLLTTISSFYSFQYFKH